MKNIVIIGAGGHAKVVADIILKRKSELNEKLNIIGFLDDNYKNLKYKKIFDISILGKMDLIKEFKNKDYYYVVAIGNNKIREKIVKENSELKYYTAIHPSVIIGNEVEIKDGTVVMANVVINSYSYIGKHCILNTASIIEHDNLIEDYVHISPNSTLCGGVKIDKYTWVGAGSTVIQGINIGENNMIGAGSVVLNKIDGNIIVVGNPARKIGGGGTKN
ncbi:MAG: acetyltransferase [Fusobacterium sp.]|nr:acetyltransferase [Fusobacterium sp.]